MKRIFYVLGPLDNPDIARIEEILKENERDVGLAYKDRRPVNQKNAYLADDCTRPTFSNSSFIFIRCKVNVMFQYLCNTLVVY